MKVINCEPNWKNLYRWFLQVQKEDPKTFAKMVKKM